MTTVRLKRYGQRPLCFEGVLMVSARSDAASARARYEVAVYEAEEQGYVAHLACREVIDGDLVCDASFVSIEESPADVIAFFEGQDPTRMVSFSEELKACQETDDPDALMDLFSRVETLKANAIDTYNDLISRTFAAN